MNTLSTLRKSQSLFVDDVIHGRDTIEQARELKKVAVSVFKGAGFDLNKWYSNAPELEANTHWKDEGQTYTKEHLGVNPNEAKLLGLPWDKKEDTLTVAFSRDS